MSFLPSVVSAYRNYFNFSGRANRREFWYFLLFAILGWLALLTFDLYYLAERLGFMPMEEDAPRWTSNAWLILCIVPTLSLIVRRVHDHDRPGWMAATILPLVWWLVAKGTREPNRYG